MKSKKILLISLSPLLLLGNLGFLSSLSKNKVSMEADNIDYEEVPVYSIADLETGEEEEEGNYPKKVELHYHNDDGANVDRRFYIWNANYKGIEYKYDQVSADGKDMSITLDFINDERFKTFYGLEGMFFIIKVKDIWAGQSDDTYIDYSLFPPNADGVTTIWSIPGEGSSIDLYATEAETKLDKIETAAFKDWKNISIQSTIAPSEYKLYAFTANYFRLDNDEQTKKKDNYLLTSGANPQTTPISGSSSVTWNIALHYTIKINVCYRVEAIFETAPSKVMSKIVSFENLYETERFKKYYTYDGDDLGVTTVKNGEDDYTTTFKVWAPTAFNMRLLIYADGTPKAYGGSNGYFVSNMKYAQGGIWTISFNDEFYGMYYNYFVYGTAGNFEVVDPYAKSCGMNGLRGHITNFDETDPEGWDEVPLKWDGVEGYDIGAANELSVYEVHVQDFTNHDTWTGNSKKGTFSAFAEKGTTYTKGDVTVKTGFDHIEELGIKAVQILPFYDHDDNEIDQNPDNNKVDIDYNWGYNPLNYNCLEGGYATDPYDGASRVTEFKNLVKAYAQNANHTRIIMDVVYNHVSSAPASSFTKLAPKYYFRYASNGSYYNGSGCGNEVKSEAPMMRKYIVDSLVFWASEYKIKGFRFDLMGLIDTDTLKEAAKALYAIDPDIVMYGEGWRGDGDGFHGKGTPAETANVYSKLYPTNDAVGVGGFNDTGRNSLRGGNDGGWGSTNHLPGWGYMSKGSGDASQEDREHIADMLWGIHSGKGGNPTQTVNYASCHDNWTLFDQLYYCLGDTGKGQAPNLKTVFDASTAAHAFIMASNGIAFMLGGEELFRTKELDAAARAEVTTDTYEKMYSRYVSHNSYNSPLSVNAFDWSRKISVGNIDTSYYTSCFANAIKLHTSMPKYPYKSSGFPYKTTSAGNPINGISWAGSELGSSKPQTYQGCAGFQLDEYFVFLAGRQWGWIQFGDVPKSSKVYEFGPNEFDNANGTVNVGDINANTGGAIVIYYRGN